MKRSEKNRYRDRVRTIIEQLDKTYISESDAGIARELLSMPEYARAERVFVYSSTGRECATREIIDDAMRSGKSVFLPLVLGEQQMVFAEYKGELGVGAFGIPEPRGELNIIEPTDRDIIVVPALCCDEDGYRLGRGGGYYDKYLAGCPAFSVCPCRERLLDKKIPREWNDLPVAAVITENRAIRNRAK